MKIPGYCTGCHRIKQVRVSGHALAMMQARGSNVAQGICDACQEKEDERVRDARRGAGKSQNRSR